MTFGDVRNRGRGSETAWRVCRMVGLRVESDPGPEGSAVVQCSKGHKNAVGQKVCGDCGQALDEFDGIAFVLALFGLVCAVMFVFALVGTTEVNDSDKLTNFALISGSNAAPWAILSLVSWGFAYAHAHVWRSWRK